MEYTLLKPDCYSWWISKKQFDNLEEWYAIKFCFKLGKNARETYGILQTAFGASCMNRAPVFELHKRFKEGKESVRDDERCARSKEVNTPELIGQRLKVRVTMLRFLREFRKRFLRKWPALFKSGQWHFHQDNTTVHNSILVTDYLTKMGINTVLQPPYSLYLAPCDFWLFPKLRGCRYERTEEVKTGSIPQKILSFFRFLLEVEGLGKCILCSPFCRINLQMERASGRHTNIYIYIYIYIYIKEKPLKTTHIFRRNIYFSTPYN